MKWYTSISLITVFSILISACKNNDTQATQEEAGISQEKKAELTLIRQFEKTMHASTSLNVVMGSNAVQAYMKYAATYPDDSLSADFLFKAGEIATATQQYTDALHCYQLITSRYPAFAYAQESLYLQGYLFDNFLNDDAQAQIIYQQFLQKYPKGNYAADATAAIANLGKTDAELIKEFEKKNKGNQ